MQKKSDKIKIIFILLFLIYMIFLFWRVFFYAYGTYIRIPSSKPNYNLIPLKTIIQFIIAFQKVSFEMWFLNLFGNVAAFLPFGFFMKAIFGMKISKAFLIGLCTSLFIEIMQLLFRIGCFDIDDILLNGIGVLMGCLLYQFIFKRLEAMNSKTNIG